MATATQNPEPAAVDAPMKRISTFTLPLLSGRTTLADALDEEENMLVCLAYPPQRFNFYLSVLESKKDYQALVSKHLGLIGNETCRLSDAKEWRNGSFNLCVPVYIDNWRKYPGRKLMLRIPLPYKVGEAAYPGNADEKLRTEAATFVWMQENCPDIPIPHLWGFGFPGGQSFMRPENARLGSRILWYIQQVLDHGYFLIDYIGTPTVQMLSQTWKDNMHDRDLRTNLFKDLSRIMLRLSQIPLPRIGSWTIDNRGVLSLTNRPLLWHIESLENESIPTNIPRDLTYTATDPFYSDLLACHDSRIRHQPNSISSRDDGLQQIANLTTMRGLLRHFMSRDLRHGPFVFSLTDLHASNIFVDENWRIKYIIDLEWACSLPAEMLAPPHWITGESIDVLTGDRLKAFDKAYHEFTDVFEEEEKSFQPVYGSVTYRADLMRRGWKIGRFWYLWALMSQKGLYNLFFQHLWSIFEPRQANFHSEEDTNPRDGEEDVDGANKAKQENTTKSDDDPRPEYTDLDLANLVAPFWAPDARETIAAKLEDLERYEQDLRRLFEQKEKEQKEKEQKEEQMRKQQEEKEQEQEKGEGKGVDKKGDDEEVGGK